VNDANIYMNPEVFGLQLLASHDIDSNDFDMVCIWLDPATDKRYAGHDSGCSCRVPFEDWMPEDLSEVRTLAAVSTFAREEWPEYLTDEQRDRAVADLMNDLVLTWRDASREPAKPQR
jgi:hypothetical protein